jgi:hypothetical protein
MTVESESKRIPKLALIIQLTIRSPTFLANEKKVHHTKCLDISIEFSFSHLYFAMTVNLKNES